MVKRKNVTQEDLKKFFEKTKKNLDKLGKETRVWMKKGEVELSKLSKMGKLEIDIVNLNIKRERLLKDIGKRVVEYGISEEIGNSAIKDMCGKVKAMTADSKKKKKEISRVGKRFLKGKPAGIKSKQ